MSKQAIVGKTCVALTADLILLCAFRQRFVLLIEICRSPRHAFATTGADAVGTDVAAGTLWILGAWTAVALLLGLAATVPGRAGAAAGMLLRAVTPGLLLRLVAAATGAAVLGGPVVAAAAAPSGTPAVPQVAASASSSVSAPAPAARLAEAPNPAPSPATPSPAMPISSTARRLPAPALPSSRPGTSTTAAPTRRTEPAPAAGHRSDPPGVVVQPGDSLWAIAERARPRTSPTPTPDRIAAAVARWYATNRSVIGTDPDLIHPGTRLRPPTDPEQS